VQVSLPEQFRQVSLPEFGYLFLVDPGEYYEGRPGPGLGLRVEDPSLRPTGLSWGHTTDPSFKPTRLGSVLVTGHYDDPASTDCRRPAGDEWPEITDEQVMQWCRGTFIVTSINTGG
jgi:hypothetical protein